MNAVYRLLFISILALAGNVFASENTVQLDDCRAYQVVEPRFGTRDWVDVNITEQSATSFRGCPSFVMINKWDVYTLASINLRQCRYEHKGFDLYCEKK